MAGYKRVCLFIFAYLYIIISDLKCSQQCLYAYNKAKKVLGMIRRTIMNKEPRIMMSLYKTLVRDRMWNIVQALGAHSTKKIKS